MQIAHHQGEDSQDCDAIATWLNNVTRATKTDRRSFRRTLDNLLGS